MTQIQDDHGPIRSKQIFSQNEKKTLGEMARTQDKIFLWKSNK